MPRAQHNLVCRHCQKPFVSTKKHQRYCSRSCATQAHNARVSPEERFWALVNKESGQWWDGTQCWLWLGYVSPVSGYGQIKVRYKSIHAHRYAYFITKGTLPSRIFVCHHCDNPPCVNPDHLFPGTTQENTSDKMAKGREARGERHGSRTHPERILRGEDSPSAKLVEADVRAIRQRRANGERGINLAREFGVDPKLITDIVRRRIWKHVA